MGIFVGFVNLWFSVNDVIVEIIKRKGSKG